MCTLHRCCSYQHGCSRRLVIPQRYPAEDTPCTVPRLWRRQKLARGCPRCFAAVDREGTASALTTSVRFNFSAGKSQESHRIAQNNLSGFFPTQVSSHLEQRFSAPETTYTGYAWFLMSVHPHVCPPSTCFCLLKTKKIHL